MNNNTLKISTLPHTWLIDIDGTLVKHNGYITDNKDMILPKSSDFMKMISEEDTIILLTSRTEEHRDITEEYLRENGIRYNHIIFGLPVGERILINDNKESGMVMSHAIALERNQGINVNVVIDKDL